MQPAVPTPDDGQVRVPIDAKLAAGWRYDASRRIFRSDSGEVYRPAAQLLARTKIVHKVPSLAKADASKLSAAERDLQRYLQVIPPAGESLAELAELLGAWPCLESASRGPDISLP